MEKLNEQKEYKVSWLKVMMVIIFIALIILIIYLVYPKKNDNEILKTYNNNLKLMKEAGWNYFKDTNLPTKIGESKRITLKELESQKLIKEILDEKGKTCNKENSYLKTTKKSKTEYSLKIALDCVNMNDYIMTTLVYEDKEEAKQDDTSVTQNNQSQNNQDNINKENSSSNKTPTGEHIIKYNITYAEGCKCDGTNCGNCQNKVYHSVYYESNGGTIFQSQIVEHGKLASNKIPVREGYKFLGWYTDYELTNKYTFTEPVVNKITLYAKWEKVEDKKQEFTVTFDPNNGNKLIIQKVNAGDKVAKISDPSKNCAIFKGWYLNDKLFDFNTPITSNITLVAKYEENVCREKYIIKYDSNGGTKVSSEYVDEGNLITKPNDPTREGYKFLGWYYNNKLFDFKTKIYQDYTLVAKWEKEEVQYHTYCKKVNDTYYSVSYVGGNQKTQNYSWTIKFDNIKNAHNLKITDIGYLNNFNDYQKAYVKIKTNKGISMVGNTGKNDVAITSTNMLQNYSLKESNFTKKLSDAYYKDGNWYTDAGVSITNYKNVVSYYTEKINSNIYFVPFYFNVSYIDYNDCKNDLASNYLKYKDYEIVETYYK